MQWILNALIVVALILLTVLLLTAIGLLIYSVSKRMVNNALKRKLKGMNCHLFSIHLTEVPDFLKDDEFGAGIYYKGGNPFSTTYQKVCFEDIHSNKYEGIIVIKKVYFFIRRIEYYFPPLK